LEYTFTVELSLALEDAVEEGTNPKSHGWSTPMGGPYIVEYTTHFGTTQGS